METHLDEHMNSVHREENCQCEECGQIFCDERNLGIHIENNHAQASTNKELELLRRRHEALKEKHEETIKKNKEYAKNLFQCIKENTELKNNAEKDAETLKDTLSINQVLVEEIKIKDDIFSRGSKFAIIHPIKMWFIISVSNFFNISD